MKKLAFYLVSILVIMSMLLTACAKEETHTPEMTAEPVVEETEVVTEEPPAAGSRLQRCAGR